MIAALYTFTAKAMERSDRHSATSPCNVAMEFIDVIDEYSNKKKHNKLQTTP